MQHTPRPQEIYRHFKGNLYQIITMAEYSETGEQLVIYQAMYGEFRTYARPLAMFMEKVDREKYPDAAQEYRFEAIDRKQEPADGNQTAEKRENSIAKKTEKEKTEKEKAEKEEAEKEEAEKEKAEKEEKAESIAAEYTGSSIRETDGISREERSEKTEKKSAAINRKAYSESIAKEAEELNMDPMVLEFLDASTYEERLNILAGLHYRITDDMINVMAMATDIEVKPGDVEERYAELRNCLHTMEKFECNRLR